MHLKEDCVRRCIKVEPLPQLFIVWEEQTEQAYFLSCPSTHNTSDRLQASDAEQLTSTLHKINIKN